MLNANKANLYWFNYKPVYIAYDAQNIKKGYHILGLIDAKILS